MEETKSITLLQRGKLLARYLYKFVLASRLYHIGFWLIYVVFVAIAVQPGKTPQQWLVYSFFILFFHALAAYFNSYVLVPKLLYARQILSYFISLVLTIIAVSFPISIIVHRLVKDQDLKNMVWSWNFFLITFLTVLFSVVFILVLKLLKNWYQEEQTRKQIMQLSLETELKFLKAQINPHFLFNSLNNLYALTLKKSELAPEIVLRLSNILRYVLYETVEGKVPLSKEVQYLKDYIELEHVRLGDRVDIRFQIEGSLENKTIEPMLFLTFVENSFKHGAANMVDKGWVNICLDSRGKDILFEISNSKGQMEYNQLNTGTGGIGLENLKKRLDLLYQENYQLLVSDEPSAYNVKLTLINP